MSHAKDAEHHKADHKLHVPPGWVHAAGRLINLAFVAAVELPVEGDPKHPLAVVFSNGQRLQLGDEDGAAFLAAAGKVK